MKLLAYAELEDGLADLSPRRRRVKLRRLFRLLLSHTVGSEELIRDLVGLGVADEDESVSERGG